MNNRAMTLPISQVDGHSSVSPASSTHSSQQRPTSSTDIRSDTSSESDVPVQSPRGEEKKKDGKDKRNSVLGIFRRKGKGHQV